MTPQRYRVPVDGGELAVARWGDRGPVVVAAHGITASHVSWAIVGDQVCNELTLIAPDLRGRGDSGQLPGPYGMAQHARDLLAVADHAGAPEVVVAGHSMGGFVATVFATMFPERTAGVVLVDGGPAIGKPPPEGTDIDVVLQAVIGPGIDRLRRTFASREEYRAFWRAHPAFANTGADAERLAAYADHDLAGPEGAMRSKVSIDAVRADGRDTLMNDALRSAVGEIDVPAVLLLAERGMRNEETPLFPADAVSALRTRRGPLETIRVPATNHYTLTLSEPGARAVAYQLRRLAEVAVTESRGA
ncbi:MAG TPA: alpha/beta hydrolase [Euzebyales bacterium]|nr:alpha/beta hydrolase [Euzebyales bacterium]